MQNDHTNPQRRLDQCAIFISAPRASSPLSNELSTADTGKHHDQLWGCSLFKSWNSARGAAPRASFLLRLYRWLDGDLHDQLGCLMTRVLPRSAIIVTLHDCS
jgi:hypothetical protein